MIKCCLNCHYYAIKKEPAGKREGYESWKGVMFSCSTNRIEVPEGREDVGSTCEFFASISKQEKIIKDEKCF